MSETADAAATLPRGTFVDNVELAEVIAIASGGAVYRGADCERGDSCLVAEVMVPVTRVLALRAAEGLSAVGYDPVDDAMRRFRALISASRQKGTSDPPWRRVSQSGGSLRLVVSETDSLVAIAWIGIVARMGEVSFRRQARRTSAVDWSLIEDWAAIHVTAVLGLWILAVCLSPAPLGLAATLVQSLPILAPVTGVVTGLLRHGADTACETSRRD